MVMYFITRSFGIVVFLAKTVETKVTEKKNYVFI